ncbi:MAG: T9SS type A sorting domain-containing protein [Ignavibacteriaceae bacterium]|nr:T9SS type A sorting domain-containing protein [Ignavibacteriaceae bacterium]
MNKFLISILFILLVVQIKPQDKVVFYNGNDGPWFEWYDFWGGSLPVVGSDTCKYGFEGSSYAADKKSIKWVMDNNDNGFGWAWWSSWNKFDYRNIFNGGYLDIWIRIPSTVDTVILEFKTDNSKRMQYYLTAATATFDDAWHHYKIPFKNWVKPAGYSEKIDSTNVTNFGIFTNFGEKGSVVYIGEVSANPIDPIVFFDGQNDPANNYVFYFWGSTWGAGSGIEPGMGYRPNTAALKWVQDIGWGSCGIGWQFTEKQDFTLRMSIDTIKFKVQTPAPADSLILEINSDKDHAVQYKFKPDITSDWQIFNIPLNAFVVPAGKLPPDFSLINEFGIFTEDPNDGLVVYVTDIWTGNPVLEQDTVPPAAPQNISVEYKSEKYNYNLIKWNAVPDESDELYNVYVSSSPISDINSPEVELLASDLAEVYSLNGVNHYFFSPKVNSPRTFYYAVTCKDKANNLSLPGVTQAVTNPAKGVAVINDGSPINFMADGDVSEWVASNIKPFIISPSTATESFGSIFSNDEDLNAKIYLAMDNDYLYIGADVTDDVVVFDQSVVWNEQDLIYIHIGLYNLVGKKHDGSTTTTLRSTEPDYVIYLMGDKINKRALGHWEIPEYWTDLFQNATDYYNVVKFTSTSYTLEAMIPLDSLKFAGDARFHPAKNMKLPLEIYIDDRDNGLVPEGGLAFSPYYNGWSWADPSTWAETWISDTTLVDVNDQELLPNTFKLEQNYPNPFNPSTTIKYSLDKSGFVKLKVFDMLGRNIATLVNEIQSAGVHSISFDTANLNLASGFYIYQIETSDLIQARKMMYLK